VWRPRPPGLAWLLLHEMRVGWRSSGAIRSRIIAALGLLIIVLAHGAGWSLMRYFDADTFLARAGPAIVLGTTFVLFFILSSAFAIGAHVLWTRGDLDLLFSSPIPLENLYAARGVFVALGTVGTVAFFLLPLANMGPFHGKWSVLAAYPVLFAIGLACVAIAFASTFTLIHFVGPRRARVLTQLAGAILGAAFVIAMQAQAFLPRAVREGLAARFEGGVTGWWLSAGSPLLWPVRAMAGEPVPALLVTIAGLALYALVIRCTTASFAALSQYTPAASASASKGVPSRRAFRTGLARIVVAKELVLIARDPSLIAKTLLQVVYMLPLFLILLRKTQPFALMASALVMLSMSIAGTLAWMTVNGEESPELLASAPVSLERLRWLKCAAALVPVVVLLVPFVAWSALDSLRDTAILVACLAGGLASSAVVTVWSVSPGGKRDLRLRYKANFFVRMAELLSSAGWAAACYLLVARIEGFAWPLALALGLAAPAAAWASARRRSPD